MTFRVHRIEFFRIDMQTRFPFRYGIASMTDLPHLVVRIEAELNGRPCQGVAADGLAPKWFTKHPETTYEEDDLPSMLRSIRHAADRAVDIGAHRSLFDWWWETYQAQRAWGSQNEIASLLAGFGCSLMERAAIDAFCRARNVPVAVALRSNLLGVDLGRLRQGLAGCNVSDCLPRHPRASLLVRHTVGLGDPLTDDEIPLESRLQDGLPHSLTENIRRYGLRLLKVKLSGDVAADGQRLAALAGLLAGEKGDTIRFTLDGNEQYQSFSAFREAWEQMRANACVAEMLDQRLLFVEQPLHRDVALLETVGDELRRWPGAPPIIIDESDSELDSFPQAISLGYRGTSHKNCKGIFKSLATVATIRQHEQAGRSLILSAEDLGNVGPIALLQDLAVVASLGIEHVERNGHHYFAGLSMFPDAIQQALLEDHPGLYHRHRAGFATLSVRDGKLDLSSVVRAPFGLMRLPDLSNLSHWDF